MKITKTNGKDERRVLIGMITDDFVCGSIYSKWERNLFTSKSSNIVSGFCAQYYKEFDKAPNKDILSYLRPGPKAKKINLQLSLLRSFYRD